MLFIEKSSKDGRTKVTKSYENFWQTPKGYALIIIFMTIAYCLGLFDK